MTEELKQKAKDFIDRINKESGGNWLDKYYLTDLLVMFATEETKELQEQIEKMKCCENCKHHHFMGDELKCYLDYDTELECLKTKQNWELAE